MQAQKEAKEKHAIGLLSSSAASEPASKRVKRTVTPVPRVVPKSKPAPVPAAKPAVRRPAPRASPVDSTRSEAARAHNAPSEKEVANWCARAARGGATACSGLGEKEPWAC
eukprot:5706232-Pleurochrysis_carterae.AAC.1